MVVQIFREKKLGSKRISKVGGSGRRGQEDWLGRKEMKRSLGK